MKKRNHAKTVLCVLISLILTTCFLAGCTSKGTLHIDYQQKDHYGSGDYVYSTITFGGSALGRELICSVESLEEKMSDQTLAYTGKYSMLTRGSIFSTHTMSGLKVYDLLVSMGLSENTPDSTNVRFISADGYVSVMKLGELKNSTDNTYDSMDAETPSVENVPVILAFSSDGKPLVGPVGSKNPGDTFTKSEGYIESANNNGGPVQLIAGQSAANEFNAPDNAKWLRKIIVGDDVDYDKHTGEIAAQNVLKMTVNDQNGQVGEQQLTYADIEAFDQTVAGYYGDEHYFSGVDFWQLITHRFDFLSRTGTVTCTFEDGTTETVDIAYLRNMSGDYSAYTTTKNERTLTCLKPGLGFSVDGVPSNDGIYALLPAAENGPEKSEAKVVTAITVNLTGENQLSENPNGSRTIKITGAGIEKETVLTVDALEHLSDLRIDSDENFGFSLYALLEESGLTVDAGDVIVKGNSQQTYGMDELKSGRSSIALVTRQNGTPLEGILCGNVKNVTEIEVTVTEGQWTHSLSPYDQYLNAELKVSGSEVKTIKTYTLKELENSGLTVRDSFGSSAGINGYEGVVLKSLIESNLKNGVTVPSKITAIGSDGYETELDVNDVMNGIDSAYQPGEHRDVILAYSVDGEPLVPDEKSEGYTGKNQFGPIRVIVENVISKWVKNVVEIRIGD